MDRRRVVVAGRRLLAVALAVMLVGSGVGAAAEFPALQTGDVETDTVVLEAALDEDGSARWSIEYRVALDDENTTEAFASLQRDIERNTTVYRSQFASRMERTVAVAENATGREMAVENVSVDTRTTLSGEYGVVRYGFEWVGFAEVSEDRLAAGDALAGLFLDADTTLTISWPEEYVVDVVDPEPDREGEQSVTWIGPTEFDTGQPQLVVRERGGAPPWGLVVGVLLFAGAGVVWYYRRQHARRAGDGVDEGGFPVGADADDEGATTSGEDDDAAPAAVETPASDASEELLSPEERVLRLLEQNDGRMKQKVVTEELDWSAARTSQVVGELREEGKVESFRLGRENVLKFPDEEEEPPAGG